MEGFEQVWPVAFVLLLLGAVLWAGRKTVPRVLGRASGGRSIETLDRVALTPQHSLHRVRAGDRELLFVTHPNGCTVIEDRGIEHRRVENRDVENRDVENRDVEKGAACA